MTGVLDRDSTSPVLWPASTASGLDERFTQEVVYTDPLVGAIAALPLARLARGPVGVSLSPVLRSDADVQESHKTAAQLMTEATGGRVSYSVASCETASFRRLLSG